MDKISTTTELRCDACGKKIPMREPCWADGIAHYHDRCKPAKTMENKARAKVVEKIEEGN